MPWGGGAGMTATREPFRRRANCVVSSTGEAESPLPWAKYRRKSPVTGGYALLLLGVGTGSNPVGAANCLRSDEPVVS